MKVCAHLYLFLNSFFSDCFLLSLRFHFLRFLHLRVQLLSLSRRFICESKESQDVNERQVINSVELGQQVHRTTHLIVMPVTAVL